VVIQNKLYTVEEFEEFISRPENRDRLFELANGEIVEKVPTEEHGIITALIVAALVPFVQARKLGRVAVETRHKIPEDAHNARLPDIAFTSAERLLPVVRQGAVPQMRDLVIEIKSPDDSRIEMRDKAAYYLKNGARLVWLVFPDKQEIEVHTAESVQTIGADSTLDGSSVLPGFTLAVRDIFAI
jgi:Uma2 family endonuclease